MCYDLTDNNFYIGKDNHGRPTTVSSMANATKFKTRSATENYIKCIPDTFRKYDRCNNSPEYYITENSVKHQISAIAVQIRFFFLISFGVIPKCSLNFFLNHDAELKFRHSLTVSTDLSVVISSSFAFSSTISFLS